MSTIRPAVVGVVTALALVAGSGAGAGAGAAPAPAPPAVTCTACLVVDDAGDTLFARRAARHLPNASTTKMMTALLVTARAALDDVVTVSPRAAATGGGGADLAAGDRYRVEDLLYGLLLSSSNDAAVALAEHVSGTEADFVDDMNAAARARGLHDTHFVTSHGLDAPGHFSSARDLARLAEELLDVAPLAHIVATQKVALVGPRGRQQWVNRNPLLKSYRGAIGVKTGYTAAAGNVLVAAAARQRRRVIAVAMHSQDATRDARRLLSYGFARLKRTVLVGAAQRVGELVLAAGSAPVVAARAVTGMAARDRVTVFFTPAPGIHPPLEEGDVVGTITVTSSGRTLARVDALAGADVAVHESWLSRLISGLLGIVGRIVAALGGEGTNLS